MSAAATHFAQSYREARSKFLAAASAAGLAVQSHPHAMLGRDGEVLAMDVVLDGAPGAKELLVVSSACHGVEGFCGSGVQVAMLADAAWRREQAASGVAVLYIHALNPHGFSYWRRVTNEGVDLNRNFSDFTQPLPVNEGYEQIAHLLVPEQWPPTAEVEAGLAAYAAEHGQRGLQAAISGGQYRHASGLFYGGNGPTWSHLTLRRVLQQHAQQCRRLGWIDLHTGLGPNGHGEMIWAGPDDAAAIARGRKWWGPEVTSVYDGSSSSALLSGLMFNAALEECAQAEYTGIAMEYGTEPVPEVMGSLRGDHWLHLHPETGATQAQAIHKRTRDAFYTDTDQWKTRIVEQGLVAARKALVGLTSPMS